MTVKQMQALLTYLGYDTGGVGGLRGSIANAWTCKYCYNNDLCGS